MKAASEGQLNPASAPETAGAILAAARCEQNVEVAEISNRLRLSISQVEALESDQYDRLPGPTFIRGIIRSYAKALEIDPQAALDAYDRIAPQADRVTIKVPSHNIRFQPGVANTWAFPVKVGLVILGLAVIGGVGWLWYTSPGGGAKKSVAEPEPKSARQTVQPAPLPAQPAPAARTTGDAPATAEAASAPMSAPPPAPASQATVSPATPAPLIPPGKPVLRLTFKGAAWVQVKDSSGKVLLSQLNTAGSERVLTGTPPFALTIGNAPSVQLTYDDKPVDLMPHITGDVARLTVK